MKFKVGDKVRDKVKNKIGTVDNIDEDDINKPYKIKVEYDGESWLDENDLELIEEI